MAFLVRPAVVGIAAGALAYVFGWQAWASTNDADAALAPAWNLAHHGSFRYPAARWAIQEFVATHHGLYSTRPLGMILVSVPGQLFTGGPTRFGATVSAALLVGLTAWLLARRIGARAWFGVLGTPLLYVAGRTLWPETVCIAATLVALEVLERQDVRRLLPRLELIALAALTTMCRPPYALVFVGVLVLHERGPARERRAWVSALAGTAIGVAVMVLYSAAVFGTLSPTGGYPVSHHLAIGAVAIGLFSPARGLLFWSPLVLAARPDRRGRAVLAVTAAYTLASWLTYDAWGGAGFPGYRYALPLAVFLVPYVSTDTLWRRATVCWSVSLGLVVETLYRVPGRDTSRDWTHTGLPAPILGFAVLVATLALGCWEYALRTRRERAQPPMLSACVAVEPPSATNSAPVQYELRSLARKSTS